MREGGVYQIFCSEINVGQGLIYNIFPKFQMRHDGFSFYDWKLWDLGADTDLIYFLRALQEILDSSELWTPSQRPLYSYDHFNNSIADYIAVHRFNESIFVGESHSLTEYTWKFFSQPANKSKNVIFTPDRLPDIKPCKIMWRSLSGAELLNPVV